MIGSTISHYRITAKIGEGGMGVVYRARDERLDRDVAIKVLPETVAQDAERLARFEREARSLASLSHQNIATLYGLEEHAGRRFLVMELAEGETLAQRLGRGPMALRDALEIAREIAEGLEAAHERGIVHRDLKPANVMLSPEGRVKILDFGLAKTWQPEEIDADSSHSPTLTARMTSAGVLLGTAAYMSPEQARGKPVDKRADIWAFGCCLYEMLTGGRAFQGETVTDVLAAVVRSEPDWRRLPADTPWRIRDLATRCLRKEVRGRLHDIADARIEIEEELADPAGRSSAVEPSRAAPRNWPRAIPWAMAVILAAALSMVTWKDRTTASRGPKDTVRLSLDLPRNADYVAAAQRLAFSPDGRRMAMNLDHEGISQIFLRELDRDEAVPLAGTEWGSLPFFSPDGEWIGFSDVNSLKKLSIQGGTPVLVCDGVPSFVGGDWGSDGSIIFTRYYSGGLWRIPASGGEPEPLTTPDPSWGELGHWNPQILSEGRRVLFTAYRSPADESRIEVRSLETGEQKTVVEGGYFGRYVPTGHLVYARRGNLYAVGFDLDALESTGSPVPVLHGVGTDPANGSVSFGFAANGTMAYIPQSALFPPGNLVWVTRGGLEEPIAAAPRVFLEPRLAPDGRRVVVSVRENDLDLWVYGLPHGAPSRLTHEPTVEASPVWTADGQRVIYARENVQFDIYWRSADGRGEEELLLSTEYDLYPTDVSPDGKLLAFNEDHPVTDGDIWILPLEKDGRPTPIVRTPFYEGRGAFSPDGRWLAFFSNESGRFEVYVQAIDGRGAKVRVSVDGGEQPVWSRDGRELYFRQGPKMMAATIEGGANPRVGRPVTLFEGHYGRYWASRAFDVSPDGRFLMVKALEDSAPRQIRVVLNWFEELKRLAPTDDRNLPGQRD